MKNYVLKISKQCGVKLQRYLNKEQHECFSKECYHQDHEILINKHLPFSYVKKYEKLFLYGEEIEFTCVKDISCDNINEFSLISMSGHVFVVCCGNSCSCKKNKIALDLNSQPFITTSLNTTFELIQTNKYMNKISQKQILLKQCDNFEKSRKLQVHLKKAKAKMLECLYLELNIIANELLFNYDVIYLENLGLTSKIKFNYKINNYVYSLFRSILVSKAHLLKKEILFIDAQYLSTKICSNCQNVNEIKVGESVYYCQNCHLTINRDYNAALNIYNKGELTNETNNKLRT